MHPPKPVDAEQAARSTAHKKFPKQRTSYAMKSFSCATLCPRAVPTFNPDEIQDYVFLSHNT